MLAGLVRHWDAGRLELLTCSATHCYLPGMLPGARGDPAAARARRARVRALVGRKAAGTWLAECAYHPSFDAEIARAGIRYTILDTHGVQHARPRPPFGVHAPICSPSGVAFFARDAESSRQVWSRDEGYPGDAYYRDFYRDIGFDLPEEELMGEVAGDGSRLMTGLKYYRITGKDVEKEPYQPGIARERAWEHAGNFVFNRAAQVDAPRARHDARAADRRRALRRGALRALVVRGAASSSRRSSAGCRETGGEVEPITLAAYLDRHPVCVAGDAERAARGGPVDTARSGWAPRRRGRGGTCTTRRATPRWLVDAAPPRGRARAARRSIRRSASCCCCSRATGPSSSRRARRRGTPKARIRAHVHRLRHLGHLVETGSIEGDDAAWLDDVCKRDNFLASLAGDELRERSTLTPKP